MNLPVFRYHPDPVASGSIVPSQNACRACGQPRGYIYEGSPYAEEDLESAICPWCIADGSAAAQFDAEFVDAAGIGGYGRWDAVPPDVIEEVSRRTPGFTGWQQEQWWTHCGDAAEFLGLAGHEELLTQWPESIDAIRAESGYDDRNWEAYFDRLDVARSPTAYIFRCRHCGTFGGYSDSH